jgi:hypothetical protein
MSPLILLAIVVGVSATSAMAIESENVAFKCDRLSGFSYHYSDSNPDWKPDTISNLNFSLIFSKNGQSSLNYGYDDSLRIDAADGGAVVVAIAFGGPDQFNSMVVIYPDDGIVETYSVVLNNGKHSFLMTSVRDKNKSLQSSGRITAMSGDCFVV